MGGERHLIPHGAGGDEEGGLLAHEVRPDRFQLVDGRVFAEDVVAHLRLGHRPAHGRRRSGHGVTAQIDKGHNGHPFTARYGVEVAASCVVKSRQG